MNTNEPRPGADITETDKLPSEDRVTGIMPGTLPLGPEDELVDSATGRGEGVGEAKEVEGRSQGQIVWGRFLRHKGAMAGLTVLLLITLFSFSAMGLGPIPGWWQYSNNPLGTHPMINNGAPTMTVPTWLGGNAPALTFGDHPFGQDNIGTDNFAAVMKGVQTSLLVMVVLGFTALVVGVVVGAISGYYRGKLDTALMRLTDLVITLPVIVLGAVLGKLLATAPDKYAWPLETRIAVDAAMPLLLGMLLGLVLWPSLARLVRAEFLGLREREFVDSARVAGASDWRIITKHILPNAVGVIIVNTTLLMSSAVVLETALSFLGFGISAPNVSLGNLISINQGAFQTRPWLFWWPGLFIILIALSINFIGDGLRDAFDPRTKRIPSKREMDRALLKIQTDNAAAEGASR